MKEECRIEEWRRGAESTAKNSPEKFRGHSVIVNPPGLPTIAVSPSVAAPAKEDAATAGQTQSKSVKPVRVRRSLTLPEQIACKYFIMNALQL